VQISISTLPPQYPLEH